MVCCCCLRDRGFVSDDARASAVAVIYDGELAIVAVAVLAVRLVMLLSLALKMRPQNAHSKRTLKMHTTKMHTKLRA